MYNSQLPLFACRFINDIILLCITHNISHAQLKRKKKRKSNNVKKVFSPWLKTISYD